MDRDVGMSRADARGKRRGGGRRSDAEWRKSASRGEIQGCVRACDRKDKMRARERRRKAARRRCEGGSYDSMFGTRKKEERKREKGRKRERKRARESEREVGREKERERERADVGVRKLGGKWMAGGTEKVGWRPWEGRRAFEGVGKRGARGHRAKCGRARCGKSGWRRGQARFGGVNEGSTIKEMKGNIL